MTNPDLEELLKETLLPDNLGDKPFDILSRWFREAGELALQPNPNAMLLSTVQETVIKKTEDAKVFDNDPLSENTFVPDARVVLCKNINSEKGFIVFFTNYQSAKGEQLKHNSNALAVFHWDHLGRQVRVSGRVLRSPAMESEEYFKSRHPLSKIGAWTSDQSQTIGSRAELLQRLEEQQQRFKIAGDNIPRPPYWGGYRLWASKIELWISHPGRIHDRAVWTRAIKDIQENEIHFGQWESSRLQP